MGGHIKKRGELEGRIDDDPTLLKQNLSPLQLSYWASKLIKDMHYKIMQIIDYWNYNSQKYSPVLVQSGGNYSRPYKK